MMAGLVGKTVDTRSPQTAISVHFFVRNVLYLIYSSHNL